MNQAQPLDLHQISQQALKMKSNQRDKFLAELFSSERFYSDSIGQKIGSKRFVRGQIIQVEKDSEIQERIILGFNDFACSSQLSLEDVDELSMPAFVLGSTNGEIRYWHPSYILSVSPYWSEALSKLEQEFLKIESKLQEWESGQTPE